MTKTPNKNVPKLRFREFEREWEVNLLEELTTRKSGHTPDKSQPGYWNGGVKWVSLSDSAQLDNKYIHSTAKEISLEGVRNSSAVLLPKGTVVLSRDAGVGKSAILASEMAVSQHFIAWICEENDPIFNEFLYYIFQIKKEYFELQAVGSTVKTIGLPLFKKLKLTLPTLPEQRKIASFLSLVDTKVAQLSRKKVLLEEYKKGCMQQLFSQKIRFKDEDGSDFPDWEEKRLGEIFSEIADGGTPSKSNDDFFGGHIPWVVIEDIQPRICKTKNTLTPEGLASSSAKLWPAGSVILSTGATIGRVGIADVPLSTKQGICGIVPSDGVNNVWVYFLLQTLAPKFERLAQGNTIKEVRAPTIKKIVAHLPHPAEQRKIADFLSALDRKIELVGYELSHTRTFKQGLLQQMFV